MLKKVYIGKSSDIKYIVGEEFGQLKFVECTDLTLTDFIKAHQPSLFDNTLMCFLNVDELKDSGESLIEFCNTIKTDVIWSFSTLPKNTKLFKKIATCSNIVTCEKLVKSQSKKDFIKELLLKNSLPLKYLDLFLMDGPEDRLILKSEIEKFSTLHKISKDESLLKRSVCKYKGSLDTLELIDHLLNRNIEMAYSLSIKVSNDVPGIVIAATLIKKIRCMLYLSIGDINTANSIWRHGQFYLNQALNQSKQIGFSGLLNMYDYVDYNFSNPMNSKDLMARLSELILYIDRKSYNKNESIPFIRA